MRNGRFKISNKSPPSINFRRAKAESEGFEPPVPLPVHRISSAARSTTPAAFQKKSGPKNNTKLPYAESLTQKLRKKRYFFSDYLNLFKKMLAYVAEYTLSLPHMTMNNLCLAL